MTNQDKLLTEKQVLNLVPTSRTSWINGIENGIYPRPVYFGRRKFWKKEDINNLLHKGTK